MKRALFILLAMVIIASGASLGLAEGSSQTFESGYYSYTLLEDGTAMIVEYAGSETETELVIPASLDGHPVSAIGDGVFSNGVFSKCHKLTSVILPQGLTDIGDWAFSSCIDLTSLVLPQGLTNIGVGTFCNCINLTSVTLPQGLTSIGGFAFVGCSRLTSIALPDSLCEITGNPFAGTPVEISVSVDHPVFTLINDVLFDKIQKKLITYPSGKQQTCYSVPKGIKSIGDGAFSGCSSLTSVTLPDSLCEMTGNPFADTQVEISMSSDHPVFAILNGVLFDKTQKKLITYPCGKRQTIYSVPEGIRSIGDWAFSDCHNLTSVAIPLGLTSIGAEAFVFCTSLTSISLPQGLTSIGDSAFFCCSSLTSVVLPQGLTSIGDGAFSHCDSLTSATLPQGLTNIGAEAFSDCSSLTSAALPQGLTSIGSKMFSGCVSLTSVTLPQGLTSIDSRAFSDCERLTSLVLPESVTFIGNDAFSNVPNLELTVPQNSYAAAWAKENGVKYLYPDSLD